MKKITKKKIKRRVFGACAKLLIVLMGLSLFQVLTFRFVEPPGNVNMVYEWILGRYFDAPYRPPVYAWRDIEEISPHLQRAVIASEDQRFLIHHGFDLTEIKNAIQGSLAGRGMRGASTITMQAARSLFLPSSRSIFRKLTEAWYTILMELTWDKKRIMEIYLNTVDWGPGLVGAQAGARAYFSCDAGKLTMSQAAAMAAILPSPHKWSAKTPGPHVRRRIKRILRQMPAMPVL